MGVTLQPRSVAEIETFYRATVADETAFFARRCSSKVARTHRRKHPRLGLARELGRLAEPSREGCKDDGIRAPVDEADKHFAGRLRELSVVPP